MPIASQNLIVATSGQISPGAVETTDIADNAVTDAKLADATQGDILIYGAAGAPSKLATGTAGQVLQAGGAGANPSWATAAAAVVYNSLVATRALSAASGAVTYAHGLGVTPKYIRVVAFIMTTAQSTLEGESIGSYNGTNTRCVFKWKNGPTEAGTLGTSTTNIVQITGEIPTRTQVATAAYDATNITLTWTLGGTGATDTIHLLLEAFG